MKIPDSNCAANVDPPQQHNTAANNQARNELDGSSSGGVRVGNSDGDDDIQETNHGGKAVRKSNKRHEDASDEKAGALDELGKLFFEVESFKLLNNFENILREPLITLKANVNHIENDLKSHMEGELPKQVLHNLGVLRNNITRVKIHILSLCQTKSSINSGGTLALQATVDTGGMGDLPHLYGEVIFETSYYFKEIEVKYEGLDIRHKLCLLCFAIFPENAEISKRLLRFWWVGENLIPPHEGKDERRVLNDTLETFIGKGLIEPVLNKRNRLQPRSYKMNAIVRLCVIKFAKDASFFYYDMEGKPTMDFLSCNKACMVKPEGAAASWGLGKLSAADLVKQHMFYFPDEKRLREASQQVDKLQTLFNLSKQYPELPREWLSKMTDLKVLYLGKWETSGAHPRHIEVEDINFLKALKNMKNLRLLSLQGISGIPKIPSSLGKLESLRILDLRACHDLERLPDRIGLLKKLTYLDLTECYLLDYIPKRLKELQELQVLKGFVIVDTIGSCDLYDLSELHNLRKLSINVKTYKFDLDGAEIALFRFKKLEKLRIAWGSGGQPKDGPRKQQTKSKPKEKTNSKAKKAEEGEDKKKKNDRFKQTANVVLAANKLALLGKVKKPRELKGLEKLVKLDLQSYPHSAPPKWLVPSKMVSLVNLSIRGGWLGNVDHQGGKWNVDTLRLMFLLEFKMNWKEMQECFPKLKHLNIDGSPRITFCPCDENGVWETSSK